MKGTLTVLLLLSMIYSVWAGNVEAQNTASITELLDTSPTKWLPLDQKGPINRHEIDRITHPPTGSVRLDPEWGEREGIIMRYHYWVYDVFSAMVDEIQDVAFVFMLVDDASTQAACINCLNNHGVPIENIEFIQVQTNSIWVRDYGPWFVWEEDSSLAIIDMGYAWSPSWVYDDYFPEFLESYWGLNYYGPDFWHDGGNMMTDGHGIMINTTKVNANNPGMSNAQINEIYQDYFGQDTVYIFERISPEMTGHIDLWAKIINDTTIMVAQMQPDDPNYQLVENHAAYMATIPTCYGTPFHVVRCPMPDRIWYSPVGYWYYTSYLNSLLVNGKALVPICNGPLDDEALAAYREALGPDWEVIGIDCSDMAYAGGAIHCTSIGVPLDRNKYLVDVDFIFEPLITPVVIPAQGGQFDYYVEVHNLESDAITFDFWIDVTLPNGDTHGPVTLREDLSLAQFATISRDLTQSVPANAPSGTYTYNGYVGTYIPEVISAEISFEFEKLLACDGSLAFSDWTISGWDDELIQTELKTTTPSELVLLRNYPNPFNPTTVISYQLAANSHINMSVYDITGRYVDELVDGWRDAGLHEIAFDASDLVSGLYIYRLTAGDFNTSGKMVLMK